MTSFELRVATSDDTEAIAQVWYTGWADGHRGNVPVELEAHRNLDQFRARVPARIATTTVAVNPGGPGGTVVGFVVVHDAEIEQIYVAAATRGSGIADALLRHGEHQIAARFPIAWLAVVAGNARARRFYERSGWSDAGAIDYPAEIGGGTLVIPTRRYEKPVAPR